MFARLSELSYVTYIRSEIMPKASGKVQKVMEEFKEGKLKSSSGKKVTNRKQAVAIGLSEARSAGEKVPPASK
jgi:hypothetical protein